MGINLQLISSNGRTLLHPTMININNYKFKKIPKFKIDDIVYLKTTYSKTVPSSTANSTTLLTFSSYNPALLIKITDNIATLLTKVTETVFTNVLTPAYTQTIASHISQV